MFEKIYENRLWGRSPTAARYFSGSGSLPEMTGGYESFIVDLIEQRKGIHTLVDLGCGDFQVAARILDQCTRSIEYIGCDIAQNLIAYNEEKFVRSGVKFQCLDMTRDALPPGDLVTIREVLQHLSNKLVLVALKNVRLQYATAVITEATMLRPSAVNLDIEAGPGTRDQLNSGLYLDQPPFDLPVVARYEFPCSQTEAYRTVVIEF